MKSKISSKNFNSLWFWFIFGIKLRILNQNCIKIINEFRTNWLLWPKKVITQIIQSLYNFIFTLGILQNGGQALSANDIFISAIKELLCVALSQNGVSPISEVFELSLALFIELLTKYKRCLKSQIEIFFKEIGLNILEATTSSFEQGWIEFTSREKKSDTKVPFNRKAWG